MKRLLLSIMFAAAALTSAVAQNSHDKGIYTDLRAELMGTSKDDISNVVAITAKYFLETPYVAHTLDSNSVEQLVVHLDRFDCMTFVETVLALSIDYMSPDPDYANFENILQKIRYRGGVIGGYPSRLHYTSDWIYDNIQKQTVEDQTKLLGGLPFRPTLNYMSTHPQSYAQLKDNSAATDSMRTIEKQINLRKSMNYIPKYKVASIEKKINSGDIIMITTSTPGLDYAHVGFAIREGNELKFLHASSDQKKVVVSSSWLHTYLNGVKNFTGITVLKAKY